MVEAPYGIIWNHLKKGEVIPFLGAGASLSGRPPKAKWDRGRPTFLPTGRELSCCLADDAVFPSLELSDRDDLAKVASYYLESSDRPSLVSHLREVFDRDYQTGEVHRFLADLPVPLLIVTTNYDDLIEKAFTRKGKPFHLVVHPTDRKELAASVLWWKPDEKEPNDYPPAKLPLSLRDVTIIYKMHGSVDRRMKKWDSFVITEEDYVEFLARMTGQSAIPARFMLHFRMRRFLFLGYGLRDWNLRVMLKSLKAKLAKTEMETASTKLNPSVPEDGLRSWAIQYQPSELEQMLWRARKVNIYDMGIDAFITAMKDRI
jgi:SIR2-like domain